MVIHSNNFNIKVIKSSMTQVPVMMSISFNGMNNFHSLTLLDKFSRSTSKLGPCTFFSKQKVEYTSRIRGQQDYLEVVTRMYLTAHQ